MTEGGNGTLANHYALRITHYELRIDLGKPQPA